MNSQFDEISTLLGRLEVPISASEAHGLLCGLLCAQPSAAAKGVWLGELINAAGLEPGSLSQRSEEIKSLDAWCTKVLESLNDANFDFNPLLPEDSVALVERIRCLGDFCAGFCYGVGVGTASRPSFKLPNDTSELIGDFNEIDSGAGEGSDNVDEETFLELSEYVRVGVLVVCEELQPVAATENQVH